MEKTIDFSTLNLEADTSTKTFEFNNNTIEVLQYLPLSDKYDLMMITLQKSKEASGLYNNAKLEPYFHLALIYLYSNIHFSDEDREDELALYDKLESSGFISAFLEAFNQQEYDVLYHWVCEYYEADTHYSTTAAGVLSKFIGELPRNAEAAKDTLNSFDTEKFKELMSFITALNGGRDVLIHSEN